MQLFKTKKNNWIPLSESGQFLGLLKNNIGYVYIFKHSTRCSISSMAKARLEGITFEDNSLYYLDLLNHRDISSLIESNLGIEHQSPQLIILKDKEVVGNLTHNAISSRNIEEIIE
jgi:bacillithiol system protein YtxJ